MHRLLFLMGLMVAIVGCSSEQGTSKKTPSKTAPSSQKPNIVFVISDDQGYGDLGINGNPILKTKNIDVLARESVNLNDYHVAPTCSPTRAALLTGHWTNRTGVWHTIMGRSMLRENETTIADILKDNGYQTAMFGKWHLGDNYPYRPMDRGFEFAYYHGGGGVGQTPDYWNNAYFDGSYFRNGVAEEAQGFVTDVFFQQAIDYIDKAKNNERPFFAYISTNAPHGPMHAPEEYAAKYANKGLTVAQQHFFGMIHNIDDNVLKLRNYLKENNLADNTIFVFTTDNGTSAGDKIYNAGMRGKKGSAYDGGHRVPFFLHWPNGGFTEQRKVDTITSYVDIVPTLLDLTGSNKPLDVEFDGKSILPLMKGNTENWSDRILITDSQRVLNPIKWRQSSVMTDQWRLIDGKMLYDMYQDPGQETDVAAAHPEVVARLTHFYENWWTELAPTFGEPTAIYLGADEANPVDLTSHDWLGDNKKVPWDQKFVRQQQAEDDGVHKGYWWVNIVKSGKYNIELRRWPEEADAAIHQDLAPGADVPGEKAVRAHKGIGFKAVLGKLKIGQTEKTTEVTATDKVISFDVELQKGKGKLQASFVDQQQNELGAYYVKVTRL
ncbi:arylsulfatase [Paraglaciecola aquimarina]|uniref:Arylsulfatase n=1 Tax=Paraglaciecola aquimarina TaxID=1235557 RepID=A0ABU3SXN7_9ALTE|nr:arylsulfatase [Paraglaciecola aquimarina]MDU0354781.1 arylsulfatase [Paraglaciecola aquimarina]